MQAIVKTVYPRVCGGTCFLPFVVHSVEGLSPRVRGNHHHAPQNTYLPRSIPACAGEPGRPACSPMSARVYPRVCGGTSGGVGRKGCTYGLSPRVRGNPVATERENGCSGSIPACAGEPSRCAALDFSIWVYPRVCGGTICCHRHSPFSEGLSPRVRGNQFGFRVVASGGGSIPACAGEPREGVYRRREVGVYPRVCGGT